MVLIAVSGISGAGKTTLIKYVTTSLHNITNIIPITNRAPRPGEQNGVDRFFLDDIQMQQLENENKLCLVNEVYRNKYGYYKHDFHGIGTKFIEVHHNYLHQLNSLHIGYISLCIEPSDICITKGLLLKRDLSMNEADSRLQKLFIEEAEIGQLKIEGKFYGVFINDYTDHAKARFLDYMISILECSSNEKSNE